MVFCSLSSSIDINSGKNIEIETLETELRQIRDEKIKGIILSAKTKWKVEGERRTRYFCNLEKRHFNDKIMTKLLTADYTELNDINDILNEQKTFYSNLYESKHPNFSTVNMQPFVNTNNPFIDKLNDQEQHELVGLLTENELLKSLKGMSNQKSPGIDGFTIEFYKFFWSDVKLYLLNYLNQAYEKGELSVSHKQGMITCLPKDGKPKEYIKNWRPISLLNVDYKLASTCISNRLQKIMNKLISDTQSGFLKD